MSIEQLLEEAREQLRLAIEEEERTQDALDSMERRYREGYIDALEGIARCLDEGKRIVRFSEKSYI